MEFGFLRFRRRKLSVTFFSASSSRSFLLLSLHSLSNHPKLKERPINIFKLLPHKCNVSHSPPRVTILPKSFLNAKNSHLHLNLLFCTPKLKFATLCLKVRYTSMVINISPDFLNEFPIVPKITFSEFVLLGVSKTVHKYFS